MNRWIVCVMLTGLVPLTGAPVRAAVPQDPAACPMHAQSDHAAGVDSRGDHVMGFDHTRTTHHFRLTRDGGSIDVSANVADDTASRDQIRSHLRAISVAFANADFSMPQGVHDRVPPGVEQMMAGKDLISYVYEETEHGARVRIETSDPKLVDAVHDFLRFQIEDHRTGDPITVGS